jgi:hypothetical protein
LIITSSKQNILQLANDDKIGTEIKKNVRSHTSIKKTEGKRKKLIQE